MRIKVETKRNFSGLVISQFMEIGFQLVAYDFTEDLDTLYFDILPMEDDINIWNKEKNKQNVIEYLVNLSQSIETKFNVILTNTRKTLPIMAQLKKDFDDVFIEVTFTKGAVYPIDSTVVIEVKLFNKMTQSLEVIFPYQSLFGLKIQDIGMKDMIFLTTEKLDSPSKIILQENEVHRETLTYQLQFNSSKYTYFVLETLATQVNGLDKNYSLPPIPITFQ